MGEKVIGREIAIDRKGNPQHVLRRFDPSSFGGNRDFGQMLNATEAAGFNFEDAAEKDRKKLGEAVMRKIVDWGLFQYLPKRGEMGNQYRMRRSRETTGPGLKRVTDRQLDIEMDSVKVLVMCNPAERPDRTKFMSKAEFHSALKNLKVRINLPLVTGHPTIHVMPQACLAFTLRGEGMIRRNFEGIRYEIYDENDARHRTSEHKYKMAQDGRNLAEDDDTEADLWFSAPAMTQDEIEDSMLEGVETTPDPGKVFTGESVNYSGFDLSDPPKPKNAEILEESKTFKQHRIAFETVYNRAQGGEQVKKLCEEVGLDKSLYYKLRKEHDQRMEHIHGKPETEEPSGRERSPGQYPPEPG